MSKIRLYTQNNCHYCTVMKSKLEDWGIPYSIINISVNDIGKEYLKKGGYRTVPQLFLKDFNLNHGYQTEQFTEADFYGSLDEFLEQTPQAEVDELVMNWYDTKTKSLRLS